MNISNDVNIDRALHELRSGRAVSIDETVMLHPEFITEENFNQVRSDARIIITKHRAFALSGQKFEGNVEVELSNLSFDDLQTLICGKDLVKSFIFKINDDLTTKASIELMVTAELLPATIFTSKYNQLPFIKLKSQNIFKYICEFSRSLKLVTEAPLNLCDAEDAKILGFRSTNGIDEHYAIIIGVVGSKPLIRIHSSCYTGDLLGSLSCDCGDQLRGSIKLMNEAGGGIIIYLMQEGRGIGLINKLRAYKLQDQGLDTVEANEFLGFDDEERSFGSAAAILQQLKINKIKLVTNNPKKISGLEKLGINVVDRVPLIITHQHNRTYLQIKSEKSGHIID